MVQSLPQAGTYLPIEDHGIIGDLHTVALVGKNGTIDWCCIPAFDAPSIFGALLDAEKGGFFSIAPQNTPEMRQNQYYLPETNILITRFFTLDGVGEITDFMPIQPAKEHTRHHRIIRAVRVVRGSLTFELTCRPAFNYARDTHTVHLSPHGAAFRSTDVSLGLFSSVPLEEDSHDGVHATFTLQQDQWAYFLLESTGDQESEPPHLSPAQYQKILQETKHYWRTWLAQCRYQGRWREMVKRSALALKLLTYAPTGAIVAAPTTSLPESMGGERNWDYRYTWLRDSALTIHSLLLLGFHEEAEAFVGWLRARASELKEDGSLQTMYTIHGGHDMTEITLDHLDGYRHSRPVRIGNGAYTQLQLDITGEFLDGVYVYMRKRGIYYGGWLYVQRLLNWLEKNWQGGDEGIWEVRGGRRAFVHSRVMCWVAFDRAIRMAQEQGLPAPLDEWRATRDTMYNEIMEKGWNEEKQSFVQYYGSDAVDASALLISLTGFTAETDPRIVHTIERIQRELMHEPHVYRYRVDTAADDGLKGVEGTFSICSFWLVEALTRAGKLEEARQNLEQMLTYANHLGLYSEEVGPVGEAFGNFPQAFTHLALISACHALDQALDGV
ncbi:MAG: glycoside hydrolase family 15 protein [Chloroflexi bacterium]|nr:MAG: glycoside hydrolase family 15 protein [Chloroflexota bacterium]